MHTNYKKSVIAAGWTGIVAAVAVAADVRTTSGVALAAGVAAMLPAILFLLWREPARTMSQNIQDGRR